MPVVPGTFTTHEMPMTGAWHVRKRSEGRRVSSINLSKSWSSEPFYVIFNKLRVTPRKDFELGTRPLNNG